MKKHEGYTGVAVSVTQFTTFKEVAEGCAKNSINYFGNLCLVRSA